MIGSLSQRIADRREKLATIRPELQESQIIKKWLAELTAWEWLEKHVSPLVAGQESAYREWTKTHKDKAWVKYLTYKKEIDARKAEFERLFPHESFYSASY